MLRCTMLRNKNRISNTLRRMYQSCRKLRASHLIDRAVSLVHPIVLLSFPLKPTQKNITSTTRTQWLILFPPCITSLHLCHAINYIFPTPELHSFFSLSDSIFNKISRRWSNRGNLKHTTQHTHLLLHHYYHQMQRRLVVDTYLFRSNSFHQWTNVHVFSLFIRVSRCVVF